MIDPVPTVSTENSKDKQPENAPQDLIPEKKNRKRDLVPIIAALFAGFSAIFTGAHTYIYWRATHVENRAYIVLKDTGQPTGMAVGDTLRVSPVFINVGHTPAYDVFSFVAIRVNATLFPTEPDIPTEEIHNWTWGPNVPNNLTVSGGIPITQDLFDAISGGNSKIFVYTNTRYKDVFHKSHRTITCLVYNKRLRAFASADKYNYAD
jgi:hypothetical protein